MPFQDDPNLIRWRLHLKSPPDQIFKILTTNEGRARFWAESTSEEDGHILFHFPNRLEWRAKILGERPPTHFSLNYFDSETSFELLDDGAGGTDLTLIDRDVSSKYREEVVAGWVSVLLALKAAVDFNIDLRNHDPDRTWDQGYCNN
jgi:uncharacterized protein YndB with AHSA1/START domain